MGTCSQPAHPYLCAGLRPVRLLLLVPVEPPMLACRAGGTATVDPVKAAASADTDDEAAAGSKADEEAARPGGIVITDLPGTSGEAGRSCQWCMCAAYAKSESGISFCIVSLSRTPMPFYFHSQHVKRLPARLPACPASPPSPRRPLAAGHPEPDAAGAQQRGDPCVRPHPVCDPGSLPAHHGAQRRRQDQHPADRGRPVELRQRTHRAAWPAHGAGRGRGEAASSGGGWSANFQAPRPSVSTDAAAAPGRV